MKLDQFFFQAVLIKNLPQNLYILKYYYFICKTLIYFLDLLMKKWKIFFSINYCIC